MGVPPKFFGKYQFLKISPLKSEAYGTSQKAKTQFDCKSNSEILSKHFVLQGLRIVYIMEICSFQEFVDVFKVLNHHANYLKYSL